MNRGDLLKTFSRLAMLAGSVAFMAGATEVRAGGSEMLASGVEAVWTTVTDAPTIAVRLELEAGLDAEGEGTWGLAAMALSALREGATENQARGQSILTAGRAGLATFGEIARDHISVTLSGPPEALATAIWLARERLSLQPHDAAEFALLEAARWRDEPPRPTDPFLTPDGAALDATYAALFGPLEGHSAYGSRRRAQVPGRAASAAAVQAGLTEARARLYIAGPAPAMAQVPELLAKHFRQVRSRSGAAPPRRDPSVDDGWVHRRTTRTSVTHNYGGQRLTTVGWDLRQVARRIGYGRAKTEATLQTLATLLGAAGGVLVEHLVDNHALARSIALRLHPDPPRALLVQAEARGQSSADTRARIVAEFQRLHDTAPSRRLFGGAVARALTLMAQAWDSSTARLSLLSRWSRGHGAQPLAEVEDYHATLVEAFAALDTEDLVRFAEYAFIDDNLVSVELRPKLLPEEERVVINADSLDMYVRLLVDLRCPPPTRTLSLSALLDQKYGMTEQAYVALTRVVARNPPRMRELNHQAEQRCLEYARLRSIMGDNRVLELHRQVACSAGKIADEAKRERRLDAIFRRFDIDASVYRPLIRMVAEELRWGAALDKIDAGCRPSFGPAVRR